MPLIQGKSKKAFKENVSKEMQSGRPQDQALAIAYSVQRKNKKKKMAQGGLVDEDANGKQQISRNSMQKAPSKDGWSDNTWKEQSEEGPSPKMGEIPLRGKQYSPDNVMERRQNEMKDEESDFIDNDRPDNGYATQPSKKYDESHEYGASPSPGVDESSPHNKMKSMKKYKDGGMVNYLREDEEDLMQSQKPDDMHDEQPSSKYDESHEYGESPSPGVDDEEPHHKSVADAIIYKKEIKKYADGGEVDLSENADEEPNNEDQMSWEALRKENYSESEGLEQLDQPRDSNLHSHELQDEDSHDMVDVIRKKIRSKRGM